ncbi:MAG: hypothetical protein NT009_04215 [Proteobacteria bacterium]|nr:hypothetical protein [Pseudomonadota bacterium]
MTINGLGTGLTVAGPTNITYEAAVEAARKSREYLTLQGVIEDPYIIGDNYQWLADFLEKRVPKFWRYLKIRESGKVDMDIIRAANILEYSRLIAKLVENFPEFSEKILPHVSKQFPEDFPEGKVFGPAELVKRLEKLNREELLEPKAEKPAASSPAPAGKTPVDSGPSPREGAKRKLPGGRNLQILNEVLAGIEEEVKKNLPQFSGFSLDSKCALLGLSEWSKIISSVSNNYPELAGSSMLEIVETISVNNRDPRIGKIYSFLKQMLS